MKKLATLALLLALCLSPSVPVLAEESDTFEDDFISITNVIEQKTIDDTVGSFYVKDALTCVAPVRITPIDDGEFSYSVKADRVPAGSELKNLAANGLENYLPESSRAELTEPGVYYVWQLSRNADGGGGFTGYLLTVQKDEDTPSTSSIPTTPTAPKFADVPADAYYADAVAWAVEKGITNGTSSTAFSPNQTCTRAQIITFLWRAADSSESGNASAFSDVAANAYYAKATAWAAANGMTSGSTFSPNAPCTREMAVEFMWKHAGSPSAAKAGFSDVSSGAVDWAVEKGVTKGTSGATFSPAQTCTRGQIVTFLYRAFNDSSSNTIPSDNSSKTPVTKVSEMYGTYVNDRYTVLVTQAGSSKVRFEIRLTMAMESGPAVEGVLVVSKKDGTLTAAWNGIEMTVYQECLYLVTPAELPKMTAVYTRE